MKRYRLRKTQIIRKAHQFTQIFEQGQRYHSAHLMIVFLQAEEMKVGFTVSRRIKGAVRRNRAKRRLRELFRLNQCKIKKRGHLILMAKDGLNEADFEDLNKEFLSLMSQIA